MPWGLVIPLLCAVLLYLLFGVNFRHRKYFLKKHRRYLEWIFTRKGDRIDNLIKGDDSPVEPAFKPFARLLGGRSLPGVTAGNALEIIDYGPHKLELLLKDIENAKEYIHFQYYLFGDDASGRAVRNALLKKVREGIKVRILHENVAEFIIDGRTCRGILEIGFNRDSHRYFNQRVLKDIRR